MIKTVEVLGEEYFYTHGAFFLLKGSQDNPSFIFGGIVSEKLGFHDHMERNKYLKEVYNFNVWGHSPAFPTEEDLLEFIKFFEGLYDKERLKIKSKVFK